MKKPTKLEQTRQTAKMVDERGWLAILSKKRMERKLYVLATVRRDSGVIKGIKITENYEPYWEEL